MGVTIRNINSSTATTKAKTTSSGNSGGMNDGNYSIAERGNDLSAGKVKRLAELSQHETFKGMYHSAGIFRNDEIDYYNKRYRYGILNPADSVTNVRSFVFITKPDLNIYPLDNSGTPTHTLSEGLQTQPFWLDLVQKDMHVIKMLEGSLPMDDGSSDPFNHLLENTLQSSLDTPSISSNNVDTPVNMYGVNYTYRGSSEESDNGFDFSLEFKDTKYLPVYKFFKAYEDYQVLKHHGTVAPWINYTMHKILYDQYSIYKFQVGDDGETIIYYAKYYGVKSKSLPREVFSNDTFDQGLSYSVDFNAAFFDDMKPNILKDFNNLSERFYKSRKYRVDVYNDVLDRVDNRPVKAAYVVESKNLDAPGGKVYKLKWRGDDEA